ncbi:unnamed protein product [Choristocarpus tenellus]
MDLEVPDKASKAIMSMGDSDEFSNGELEESGFDDSVEQNDKDKERKLLNDKYDMALEVSASASMDGDEMEDLRGAIEDRKRESILKNTKFDETLEVSASGDRLTSDLARKTDGKTVNKSVAEEKGRLGNEDKAGRDVKNDQFDAAYDLSSADEDSSIDTRDSNRQSKSNSKRTIWAPSSTSTHSKRQSSVDQGVLTQTPGTAPSAGGGPTATATVAAAAAAAAAAAGVPAMGVLGSGVPGGSDGSESGSETSSNEGGRGGGLKVERAYNPADYAHLNVSAEIKDLFQYIGRYKSHDVELETTLRCFVPDYIPAVGDMDAFLKIPRPDDTSDDLGFKVLDEPAASQSDATVLELQLRAVSKKQHGDVAVRSIENAHKNPAEIERWIQSITDMHRIKPPPQVHYKKNMPDIEVLMEAWPPEFEEVLEDVNNLTPEMDMPLEDYARMVS